MHLQLYGGTYNLYAHTIKKMGVDATFVDPECTDRRVKCRIPKRIQKLYSVKPLPIRRLLYLDLEKFANSCTCTWRTIYCG